MTNFEVSSFFNLKKKMFIGLKINIFTATITIFVFVKLVTHDF